ncbi:MAG: response regulator transcription factor, partial [Myxococcaceae bacterium]
MAPKILVVDDNQELLTLLTQLFEDGGYQVLAASRGKQAVEVARGQDAQLAVLDLLLPDMMGFHLADALRKEQPQLPIIFITGVFKGGKHALEAKSKYASAGYFEKPFEAQKLLAAIAAVVPPEKTPPARSLADAFEVELDFDVEEDAPQEAMELTGKIRVSDENISAELTGEKLTASSVAKGQTLGIRVPPPGTPLAAGPTRATDPG